MISIRCVVNLRNVSNELLRSEHLESGQVEPCVANMVCNLFPNLNFPMHNFSVVRCNI